MFVDGRWEFISNVQMPRRVWILLHQNLLESFAGNESFRHDPAEEVFDGRWGWSEDQPEDAWTPPSVCSSDPEVD